MGFADKIAERTNKISIQMMVHNLIKQKRLEFVNDHQVIYTDKDNVTKQLTFDQFATLTVSRFATIAVEKSPVVLQAGFGITDEVVKNVLIDEYKKGVKK